MPSINKPQLHALLQDAIDAYHAGDLRKAIALLSENAKRFPRSAKLWGYFGFLHSECQQYAKAASAYKKTVHLSPNSELASLGLFHNLWRIGKTDDAFDEMRRFLKANDSPHYRQMLREMLADAPDQKTASVESLLSV